MPEWVDHVVFGNVMQTSADAIYGARHVALKAGVPIEVPALTVNRLCGSGIQAAVSGARAHPARRSRGRAHRRNGEHEPGAARDPRPADRAQLGQGKLEDTLWEALTDTYCGCSMAITAENCAGRVRDHARGAGRLRPAQPAARRTGVGRGAARRRGRAGRDQDPQRNGRSSRATIICGPRPRSRCSRSCPPRSRRTAGHRRQRQRHRRRWRRPRPGVARSHRRATA